MGFFQHLAKEQKMISTPRAMRDSINVPTDLLSFQPVHYTGFMYFFYIIHEIYNCFYKAYRYTKCNFNNYMIF